MKKTKSTAGIILLLLFTVTVAACAATGGRPSSPSGSAQPSSSASALASAETSNAVIMKNHTYQPAEITISKGETVTWTNEDASVHDVSGDGFKSDSMKKGGTYSCTFNEAGTFDYTCTFHPGMNGTVIVK